MECAYPGHLVRDHISSGRRCTGLGDFQPWLQVISGLKFHVGNYVPHLDPVLKSTRCQFVQARSYMRPAWDKVWSTKLFILSLSLCTKSDILNYFSGCPVFYLDIQTVFLDVWRVCEVNEGLVTARSFIQHLGFLACGTKYFSDF